MSIYSTTVNCTYHDAKHLSGEKIDKKEDYSCTLCQRIVKFNEGTNTHRFWEFYQLAFLPAYQANSVTRQAYTQLVSILTKKTSTLDDENLVERLLIKLVESICYHYLLDKSVAVTAWILRKVIAEIIRFAEESTPHTILANLKKREKKD